MTRDSRGAAISATDCCHQIPARTASGFPAVARPQASENSTSGRLPKSRSIQAATDCPAPLREQRRRLPLTDAGQRVEPPRRPWPPRDPPTATRARPSSPAGRGTGARCRSEHGVDRQGPRGPVVAREVGHEGGEDLERREGDVLGAVRFRGYGATATSFSGWWSRDHGSAPHDNRRHRRG